MEISWISTCACCLLSLGTTECSIFRLVLYLTYSSLQVFIYIDQIPLSLLCSRLNGPSLLSSCVGCSNPLPSLWPFAQLAVICPCPSCSGELVAGLQVFLTEHRKRITSLYLLVSFFLVQAKSLLAFDARMYCWLTCNFFSLYALIFSLYFFDFEFVGFFGCGFFLCVCVRAVLTTCYRVMHTSLS